MYAPQKGESACTPKKLMQSNLCDLSLIVQIVHGNLPFESFSKLPQPPDCSAAVLSLWPGSLEATLTPGSPRVIKKCKGLESVKFQSDCLGSSHAAHTCQP